MLSAFCRPLIMDIHRIYVDIMTVERLLSIQVANLELISCSVGSSSKSEGDGVKGVEV